MKEPLFKTDLRSQYSIFLVSDSSVILQSTSEIEQSGYNFRSLSLMKGTLDQIKSEQPDVIILDTSTIEGGASLYAERVQAACPTSIILSIVESVDEGLSLKGQVYDFLLRPFVRTETLLMMLDKACEKLYFEYHVTQLLSEKGVSSSGSVEERSQESSTSRGQPAPTTKLVVSSKTVDLISKLENKTDAPEGIATFLEFFTSEVENKPILFFKYLGSHHSMVLSQCSGLAIDQIRGIGVELKKYSLSERDAFLQSPQGCPEFQIMMGQLFAQKMYSTALMKIDGKPYGWIVKLGEFAAEKNEAFFYTMVSVAEKIIENKVLKFKIHNLQTESAETGLATRNQFYRTLKDEVARSRRTHLPASLITISIDQFDDYEKSNGIDLTIRLRRSLADLLTKTSRITDIGIDLLSGDFALVMPHTDQKGAAIKAEKLRRVFNSSQFPGAESLSEKKITLSIGVSEYPGFSGDADTLMKSADDALFYVKNAGGNRVCLAEKPQGFVPDFKAKATPR